MRTLREGTAPSNTPSIVPPSEDPAPGTLTTDTLGYPGRTEAQVSVADDGTWAAELTIPAGTPPGDYPIAAICFGDAGGKYGYPTPIYTVTADDRPPPVRGTATTLPETGAGGGSLTIAAWGLGAAVLGGVTYALGKRRVQT